MSYKMYYDTNKNDHGLPYNPFKALTVPRPIGWISTVNKKGIGNLAPYSYFNGLSYDPPFVMFSAGNRADGSKKDSVLNAEETGEFVVNMSTWDTRQQMNDTSWIMEPDTNELEKTGLTAIDSINVKPKRVLNLQSILNVNIIKLSNFLEKEGYTMLYLDKLLVFILKTNSSLTKA